MPRLLHSVLPLLAVFASCPFVVDAALNTTNSTSSSTKYFITFGDSYSSTGFNITGTQPSAANPLGNPALPGYTTTGGLNWIGSLATHFTNNTTTTPSLLLSYNFASGGATTDASIIPSLSGSLSFAVQTAEFGSTLGLPPGAAARPADLPVWNANDTLVGVWMGVNDVGNVYGAANASAVVEEVVGRYFELMGGLYDKGVRNFVVLSVPPTNLTPLMLAQNSETAQTSLVAAIAQYNHLLSTRLARFVTDNGPNKTHAWMVDTAPAFEQPVADPTAYGAPNATCYDEDGTTCLWYNNYHPGIAIQRLVAQRVAAEVGMPWFGS